MIARLAGSWIGGGPIFGPPAQPATSAAPRTKGSRTPRRTDERNSLPGNDLLHSTNGIPAAFRPPRPRSANESFSKSSK